MSKSNLWVTLVSLGAIGCVGIGMCLNWRSLKHEGQANAADSALADLTEVLPRTEPLEIARSQPPLGASRLVRYQPSQAAIANPERGFFWQKYTLEGDPATVSELRNARRQENVTTIRGIYDLKQYRDRPLPQSLLIQFQRDCDIYRQAGMKVMPLFYYAKEYTTPQQSDAPLEILLQHINQLKPLIEKNQDVITVWYAGFIGPYGEWWGSEHINSDNKNINQNSRKFLNRLLEIVPKNRSILLRKLIYKQQFLGSAQPLAPATAFKGTPQSRLGHQNDGLGADPTEGQVFSKDPATRRNEETYLHDDNRFVPAVAETEYFDGGKSSHCARNLELIRSRRYSLIHKRFNLKTLNLWRQEGCFDEIEKKIGYRFVAIQSELPQSIAKSRNIPLRLTLQNQGWTSPFNRRAIEIIFKQRQSGKVYRSDVSSQSDPRYWLPEKGKLTIDLKIPNKLAPGTYSVYLNLPDPLPSLRNRPEYSIQLANNQMWDEATGFNNLNRTIEIR